MMYNFKANVYNTRLGPDFGTITTVTVIANNKEEAWDEARKSFNKYIQALYTHHNIDGNGKVRKTLNSFDYNNLELCL